MRWSDPPEIERFRAEVRAWVDDHLEDRFVGLGHALEPDASWLEAMRTWNRLLADARLAAVDWPEAEGGRGAGLRERVVVAEELARRDAPGTLNPIGLANIAPAIRAFGTHPQRAALLWPMLRGDEIWCQGFSEPDAGSDLASLTTSAVRDGDHYVVNGRKVWNTLGHLADRCELLARTDPDAPRHRGISCLLVDMRLPGIEVRPLVTITGDREFSELVFSDVRVPVDALLGPEHDGWRVAMATLANERAGVADLHLSLRRKVGAVVELARTTERDGRSALTDPHLRRRLAAAHLDAELLKLLADRAISGQLHGRPLGPESSLAKLVWSDLEQELARLAGDIAGPSATTGRWGRERLASRALSIAGGTTQVNKNILAQRVLGMPRT